MVGPDPLLPVPHASAAVPAPTLLDAAWRRAIFAVVAIAGAIFIIVHHREIGPTWQALQAADLAWTAAGVAGAGAWTADYAWLHRAMQRAVGLTPPSLHRTLPFAVTAHFLNIVTKSGALAGLVAFDALGRARDQPRGAVAGAYLAASVLAEVAFAAVLAVALFLDASYGHLSLPETVAAAVFAVYCASRFTLLVVAVGDNDRAHRLAAMAARLRVRARRRPDSPREPGVHRGIDELSAAIKTLRTDPTTLVTPALAALGLEFAGLAMLWCAIAAVGGLDPWPVALIGYGVSTLFAIVGLVPAGLGFVEISLGAVLVSFGSTVPEATATVALYRFFALWLPVGAGAVTTRSLRHHGWL